MSINTAASGIKSIKGGLYLVVDPKPGLDSVLPKVEAAIRGGVDIIQIWDHWSEEQNQEEFIQKICALAHRYGIPVFINEKWSWLKETPLDGVHFDQIPVDITFIRNEIDKPFLTGLTCGNDLERIHWAVQNGINYISFCAMYPSPSVSSCDIVRFKTVQEARKLTDIPIFASGGIRPDNIHSLLSLGVKGIAVISGILKSESPEEAARKYKQALEQESEINT
ncbi:MAG TPA: thiamine phosphate synthase [Balneolales bacterium]|nr:thiamine phosphate synthase [Balneolales bacterium]